MSFDMLSEDKKANLSLCGYHPRLVTVRQHMSVQAFSLILVLSLMVIHSLQQTPCQYCWWL